MDKRYLSPLELLNIATQHAYAADYLLQQFASQDPEQEKALTALAPITSLMHQAFLLTLKAYALHEHRSIKEPRRLMELIELNHSLDFSSQEISLLKELTRQQAFHKGSDYELWENCQQLHVFCEKILSLYQKLQTMMPLELLPEYQS